MKVKRVIVFIKLSFFILLFLLLINLISGYFSERVRLYITQKARLEIANMISNTIKDEVLPSIDMDNLVKTTTNENSKVESIFINTYQVNNILANTSSAIEKQIKNIDDNTFKDLYLPLGIILSDVLFTKLGPNINIYIYPVGSVRCDVQTKYDHYGINSSILRLDIVVEVEFDVIIPLQKNQIAVTTNIPIVVQIIQGEVPRYYYYNTNSQFIPYPIEID